MFLIIIQPPRNFVVTKMQTKRFAAIKFDKSFKVLFK